MTGSRLMPTVRMMVSHRYGCLRALEATPARQHNTANVQIFTTTDYQGFIEIPMVKTDWLHLN